MSRWQELSREEKERFAFLDQRTAIEIRHDPRWFAGLILKFYPLKTESPPSYVKRGSTKKSRKQ